MEDVNLPEIEWLTARQKVASRKRSNDKILNGYLNDVSIFIIDTRYSECQLGTNSSGCFFKGTLEECKNKANEILWKK